MPFSNCYIWYIQYLPTIICYTSKFETQRYCNDSCVHTYISVYKIKETKQATIMHEFWTCLLQKSGTNLHFHGSHTEHTQAMIAFSCLHGTSQSASRWQPEMWHQMQHEYTWWQLSDLSLENKTAWLHGTPDPATIKLIKLPTTNTDGKKWSVHTNYDNWIMLTMVSSILINKQRNCLSCLLLSV